MTGENASSASLLMTKLGGAGDTGLHAGRNNSMYQYMLGATCLKSSCPEGDLGIPVDMNPSSVHLWQTRLTVPWAALDNLLPAGQDKVNLPLFAALVRPHLMHCAQFYSTGEIQNYWRMQQGVKAAQHLSFKERLGELGLFNLAKRRLGEDLGNINVYKYWEERCKEGRARLFSVVSRKRTGGNGHRLKHRRCQMNIRKYFIVRVTEHWSGLPREVAKAPAPKIFKRHLDTDLGNLP